MYYLEIHSTNQTKFKVLSPDLNVPVRVYIFLFMYRFYEHRVFGFSDNELSATQYFTSEPTLYDTTLCVSLGYCVCTIAF